MRPGRFLIHKAIVVPFLCIFLIIAYIRCADSLDKSPVSSIPDIEIPDDIPAVSSNTHSLQIKGGSIGTTKAYVYIRLEDVKYTDADIWIRLSSLDSSYTFQEILNREPNNYINDVTYRYVLSNLSAGTDYYLWLVWQNGVDIEHIETNFQTLSE